MVFNSNVFLLAFFPVVFSAFWIARTRRQRYVVLIISSYVFYGYWDWRFCFLLLFSSLFSYVVALQIGRSERLRTRRLLMAASITVDLSILGFFKYYDFAAGNLHRFAHTGPPILNIVLPVGISFYTFHTISYVVDVAVGRIRPAEDLAEYLCYVCLFSQLVAGPIVRFRQIKDDLEHLEQRFSEDFAARGVGFFVVGLVKKVMIADQVAKLVDPLLASFPSMSTEAAWIAALGYTMQIYFDFSGYSDMAVGLGYLFNVRIPQNFNAPYRATSLGDFWHRWHISLSTFLRDYLYIPLGGSRAGVQRTYVNLLITMLLGGLWHGAHWTFVVWGAYHGLLLCVERLAGPVIDQVNMAVRRGVTFLLVVIGWVFFRAGSVSMAVAWLGKMVGIGSGPAGAPALLIALVALGLLVVNLLPETWDIKFPVQARWAVTYALAFFVCFLFIQDNPTVFLYYQF